MQTCDLDCHHSELGFGPQTHSGGVTQEHHLIVALPKVLYVDLSLNPEPYTVQHQNQTEHICCSPMSPGLS